MKFYTLGTSHGATEKYRSCSGNLIEINGDYYLFDCGGDVERKMTDMELHIGKIKTVFVSHMHCDHVTTLPSIAKFFTIGYNGLKTTLKIFLPDKNGLDGFKCWLRALSMDPDSDKLVLSTFEGGTVYQDENVTITAIPTKHMFDGAKPSFAFMIETSDGKRVLYTGDLNCNFLDYPKIVFEKDFDLIVSELVHFNVEKNLDTILASRTKKLVFTHLAPRNIPVIENVRERFPFEVFIAQDGNCYEV